MEPPKIGDSFFGGGPAFFSMIGAPLTLEGSSFLLLGFAKYLVFL